METELSFLLTLLLEHKLPKATKDALKARIKEIQANPTAMPVNARIMPPMAAAQAIAQAPSTMAALERQPGEAPVHPAMAPAAAIRLPPATIDKETGRPMTATGNGTKGPRKW